MKRMCTIGLTLTEASRARLKPERLLFSTLKRLSAKVKSGRSWKLKLLEFPLSKNPKWYAL